FPSSLLPRRPPPLLCLLSPSTTLFRSTGEPLASAVVAIDSSNPPNSPNSPDSIRVEVAAADGSFVFADVLPGKYVLSARHRGYIDRKSTRLNSSHQIISYAVFCLKNKT